MPRVGTRLAAKPAAGVPSGARTEGLKWSDDQTIVANFPGFGVLFGVPLVDHQHHFGGLDDGSDFAPHLDVEFLDTLLCDDAFDQVFTYSNAHFCGDYAEVDRFDRASQLITR
jgi:hypothetical protein